MAIPIIPIITAAASLLSSASNKRKARQAEQAAEEKLNSSPKYRPNQSILDYYKMALNKFNTSPIDTAEYKRDSQRIKQGTVQALSSMNKLRGSDVANIVQGQNNALLNAAAKAESRKAQEFNVLGQATQMKAGQDAKAFQQNELYPFEGQYNLLTMKAAGHRADQRQSTQNAYNNALSAASIMAGGDGMGGIGDGGANSWGTGRNILGQPTRNFMGSNYTRPKYTKLNNQWMNNWNTGMRSSTGGW